MDWNNISELREVAGKYLQTFGKLANLKAYEYDMPTQKQYDGAAALMRYLTQNFNLDEVSALMDSIDPHTTAILDDEGLPAIIYCLKALATMFDKCGDDILDYDENAFVVEKFAINALEVFEQELSRMEERRLNEPTQKDKDSVNKIDRFIAGRSREKSLSDVLEKYVFKGLSRPEFDRRKEYLLTHYADNADVVSALKSVVWKSEITPVQPQPTPSDSATTKEDSTLFDLMLLNQPEQKQKFLDVLRKLVDGNKGKLVALVFLVCVNSGLIRKPTHKILTSTFGDIGAKSGYNNYYSKGLKAYTQEQIKGIESHILPFVNGH